MKFEEYRISPEIKKNLETLGFKRPTDIQYKAIPSILKGEDVLAIAQTGTGKTAAFAIPIVHLLQETKQRSSRVDGIKCIVMVPTRELAIQITEVFQEIGKNTKVHTVPLFGGVDQNPQIQNLQIGFDILVATPGRVFDLVHQGHLDLHRVEILILDEADHMLDLGFLKDIEDLIKKLPKKRQTLFFSATINDKIKKLAYSLVKNAIRIQISPDNPVNKNIQHSVAFVEMDHKRFFLERLIQENPDSKVIVFVRTKVRAERVAKAMDRAAIKTVTIHGDKDQENRFEVMKDFRSGLCKVLIATDVSARGIDIANVDYVVNYDLPDVAENYVHRVGRTGRGVQKGNAVTFCATEEIEKLKEIEAFIGTEIGRLEVKKKDYQETLDFTSDPTENDWKSLLDEAEKNNVVPKKKKK